MIVVFDCRLATASCSSATVDTFTIVPEGGGSAPQLASEAGDAAAGFGAPDEADDAKPRLAATIPDNKRKRIIADRSFIRTAFQHLFRRTALRANFKQLVKRV
jgi:hypothetical protein